MHQVARHGLQVIGGPATSRQVTKTRRNEEGIASVNTPDAENELKPQQKPFVSLAFRLHASSSVYTYIVVNQSNDTHSPLHCYNRGARANSALVHLPGAELLAARHVLELAGKVVYRHLFVLLAVAALVVVEDPRRARDVLGALGLERARRHLGTSGVQWAGPAGLPDMLVQSRMQP